jgi:hypothetical protein
MVCGWRRQRPGQVEAKITCATLNTCIAPLFSLAIFASPTPLAVESSERS